MGLIHSRASKQDHKAQARLADEEAKLLKAQRKAVKAQRRTVQAQARQVGAQIRQQATPQPVPQQPAPPTPVQEPVQQESFQWDEILAAFEAGEMARADLTSTQKTKIPFGYSTKCRRADIQRRKAAGTYSPFGLPRGLS